MRRVLRSGSRAQIAREVDDELAFHLAMRVEKLIAAGLSPEAARREAERQFGDVRPVREYCISMDNERERAMRRANLMDELRKDLVYAGRMLRRNLGFTIVIVLTLALGIGANSAIFTLVNAVLLKPIPVREPERLIALGDVSRTGSVSSSDNARADLFSYPLYKDVRDAGGSLTSGLVASGRTPRLDILVERGSTGTEHARGRFVSANYFQVLGIGAGTGRVFDGSEDESRGGASLVVISDGWFTRRFERDPRTIGREIVINGLRFTIIGVAPPGFTGEIVGRTNDLWIPLSMQDAMMPNERWLDDRATQWLLLLGRLAPGVSMERATTGYTTVIRQQLAAHPIHPGQEKQAATKQVFISSGSRGFSSVRRTYTGPLLTLMVGVGLLLLIVCANVANLLLARAVARAREMSVRLAIGARRSRLVRQLLTESLVLSLLGAAAGLFVAWWGSQLLLALAADGIGAVAVDVRPDGRVLGFTLVLSVLSIAFFGLVPALRASRVDLATTMRATAGAVRGGLGARGQRMPLGAMLISGQVALSLVLLVGAALLVRSLQRIQDVPLGLDRDHLVIADVEALERGYKGDRWRTLMRDLTERVRRIPGVAAVTYSENGIFSGTESGTTISVPGFTMRTAEDSNPHYDRVGPTYARTIGARVLRGRDIEERDAQGTAPVALVNETFAKLYFNGARDVIGRTFTMDSATVQVVGLLADVRDHSIEQPIEPRFYVAYAQTRDTIPGSIRLEVRTSGNPGPAVAAVRRELRAVDVNLGGSAIDQLTTLLRQGIAESRLLTKLASGFGVLALLLAAVGLYGVLTYAVSRRTGEIGLRVALGAQPRDVVGLVLRDATRLVMIGVVIGVPLSFGASRLLRSQLFGVESFDPIALLAALAVLVASAMTAALLPALRAARLGPIVALRQE